MRTHVQNSWRLARARLVSSRWPLGVAVRLFAMHSCGAANVQLYIRSRGMLVAVKAPLAGHRAGSCDAGGGEARASQGALKVACAGGAHAA